MDFIPPKPQSELNGEFGLTVNDIATSLGIKTKHVREKLEQRGLLDRIKSCDFNVVAFATSLPHGGNGAMKEGTDYVLDLNAAKWFVGKYNNEAGDKYLAYLVKHESDTAGLSKFTDPTNLTELLGNPDTILRLAQNWKDALVAVEEQKEIATKAIREKGQISSSREASCMAKVGVANRKIRVLETKLDVAENWRSAAGWMTEFPQLKNLSDDPKVIGKHLKAMSLALGYKVDAIPDQRWGKVNSYNREAVLNLLSQI